MSDQPLPHAAESRVTSSDLFGWIAALWEHRPEELERVASQVKAIHDKLPQWGWETVDEEELDHATIAYSKACASYYCCEWLPFDVMGDWEEDVWAILMDEEFYFEQRALNKMGYDIAEMIRDREQNAQPNRLAEQRGSNDGGTTP